MEDTDRPLVVLAERSGKCDEQRVYVNKEGARVLLDMLKAFLSVEGECPVIAAQVFEDDGWTTLQVVPSTQADFDTGK